MLIKINRPSWIEERQKKKKIPALSTRKEGKGFLPSKRETLTTGPGVHKDSVPIRDRDGRKNNRIQTIRQGKKNSARNIEWESKETIRGST